MKAVAPAAARGGGPAAGSVVVEGACHLPRVPPGTPSLLTEDDGNRPVAHTHAVNPHVDQAQEVLAVAPPAD